MSLPERMSRSKPSVNSLRQRIRDIINAEIFRPVSRDQRLHGTACRCLAPDLIDRILAGRLVGLEVCLYCCIDDAIAETRVGEEMAQYVQVQELSICVSSNFHVGVGLSDLLLYVKCDLPRVEPREQGLMSQ